MWVFARLFRRYRVDLLFLFLMILGFYILHKTNSFQGMMINNFFINVSSSVNSRTKLVTDYFGLKSKNKKLTQRIAQLQNHKDELKGANSFANAQVTYIDLNKQENYLIINRGSDQGINLKTLVVTPDNAVIGRVRHTTGTNSLVQTVLSTKFNLTAKLQDGTMGLTYWDGQKFGYVKMKNIPSYVKVAKGDKVVTSGKGIFPEGVYIGVIDDISVDEATKFYIVDIKLSADFYKLDEVITLQQNEWQAKDTLIEVRDSIIENESTEL